MDDIREEPFRIYFRMGLNNKEILHCLEVQHRIIVSERTLRRISKKCNIYRRKHLSDILDVAVFILKTHEGSGRSHGYRWMHLKCIQHGLLVSQKTVRLLQGILNPTGVEARLLRRLHRRQYVCPGTNAVWHIDGYDKLKPFGLCIHGCIDGFSRQVIWLKVWNTNNNPKVIAGYFLDAVVHRNGCPVRVRGDAGTENCYVKQMQIFLRTGHIDRYSGRNSYLTGPSTANQRIEAFWGILRKQLTEFWIELFKNIQNDGHFEGDFLDKNLVQFCFTDIMQSELDFAVQTWNCHHIRKSGKTALPHGRPFMMYTNPYLYGVDDHIQEVNQEQIDCCESDVIKKSDVPCDNTVNDLCKLIIAERQWLFPGDPYELCDLYISPRQEIRRLILDNCFKER